MITLDVGGTSTDVALLRAGQALSTNERVVGGYPIALPSIEIQTIGAGGGSLARVDEGGLLRVGPESAGSEPGPVCYRRGGVVPTVTDCHVALGIIGESSMLGGAFPVSREAAVESIKNGLARPLGTSWARAASGVIEVATANMVRAVRRISVERGYDPRDAVLVAYGGAGPLHAAAVALALGMRRVLIPASPGVFSALGMLASDMRYESQRTSFARLADIDSSPSRANSRASRPSSASARPPLDSTRPKRRPSGPPTFATRARATR